jgi:dephospho-CoA kinase
VTISSDEVAHEMLADAEMRSALVERWGEEVVKDGEPDREAIAARVFEQPDELAWLESELHPRVGRRIGEWAAALEPAAVGVVEVPLLFEAAMEDAFDAIVCVVAADAVRRERLAARGQGGLEGREARQLSQDEKASRADYVIENDGSLEELEARIAVLLPRLTQG